ncbi:hemin-degrading factor [Curvivirga sp.]|uniref:hemin-degrading factor n=1 Tax=Curvivirga sp. TaxID=2856848 RepID=UPI003B5CAAB0
MSNPVKEKMIKLKAEEPNLRARDIAAKLGISEGELLAAQVGDIATVLKPEIEAILTDVEALGEVMALTRNEACVHERKGIYEKPQFSNMGPMRMGLYINPDIDLRLFLDHWAHAFAVTENVKSGQRHSLQFFDKEGVAIHKIYVTDMSDKAAFDALVEKYKAAEQTDHLKVETYDAPAPDQPDENVDWKGFREAWENMKDIHEFFPMLKKFKVGREQSFRNIGEDFAYQVTNEAPRQVLDMARDQNCKIMVFVGNRGCIQIHTGDVHKLMEFGDWYNVLDPKFNLHLDESKIHSVWVSRKPSEYGNVTSVEVFDEKGETIAMFFGQRDQKSPEQELWRGIVAELSQKEVSNAA